MDFWKRWRLREPGNGRSDLTLLRKSIAEPARLTPEYLILNLLAAIVASYGLLQNSTAVVIGAMIIAMLLGPINGLALAVNDGDLPLLRRALSAEVVGALLVFFSAWCIGQIHSGATVGSELMARTSPNVMDLIIALAGGAAGAYSLVSPRLRSGAVGVAIATALVPPICTAGIMFSRGEAGLGFGGLLLFATNLVAIQIAASAVLWMHRLHRSYDIKESGALGLLKKNAVSLGLMVILVVLLSTTFARTLRSKTLEQNIRQSVTASAPSIVRGARVQEVNVQERPEVIDVFAVVMAPVSLDPAMVARMQQALPSNRDRRPYRLRVRSIITKEASADGWRHLPAAEGGDPTITGTTPDEAASPVVGELPPEDFIGPPPKPSPDKEPSSPSSETNDPGVSEDPQE